MRWELSTDITCSPGSVRALLSSWLCCASRQCFTGTWLNCKRNLPLPTEDWVPRKDLRRGCTCGILGGNSRPRSRKHDEKSSSSAAGISGLQHASFCRRARRQYFAAPHQLARGHRVGAEAQSQRPHRWLQGRGEAAHKGSCEKRLFSQHTK